jgi:hypothetical protein
MLKNKRLLLIPLLLAVAAIVILGMRIGYPHHRLTAFILLGLGWIPLMISYRINRRLLHVQKQIIRKKTRPFLPHAVVALCLVVALYATSVLFPVTYSPLPELTPSELRQTIEEDLDSCLMLCRAADDLVGRLAESNLLEQRVDSLTVDERNMLRSLWRDGVMVFLEFDFLKAKYRGFYQIDYLVEPALHADAFMLAYMAYVSQYNACLQIAGMVGHNDFMETLLNEEGEGIPGRSYYFMKQRLTNPNVVLRMNAAAAYYELVKKDVTLETEVITDFLHRRKSFYHALGRNADLLIENPLDLLERTAFETILPIQKNVALQMSHVRTAKRDYLITPELLERNLDRLLPGDILIQRRNWHMTNIGIPGFWPHVALYIGTPAELEAYFNASGEGEVERIAEQYPDVWRMLGSKAPDGYPIRVIESIRPGVVFQSLETSARCDYLGVIRPNLTRAETFDALMRAFSHYGKPYDLNFDFTTDNELVCSELVYKAYKSAGLPLEPEVINGRRLLPPNRLAEDAVENMGDGKAFSFVLFLDAVEKEDTIVERDEEAFRISWLRPKWDVLQK